MRRFTSVFVFVLLAVGCGGSDAAEKWVWDLPDTVPEPRVPDDNPMSVEKVELGRFLFYDKRLSGNQTQSCGTCHMQELAFTDGLPQAVGSTGQMHPRGSMSIANAGYAASLTWANETLVRLERQALVPMFGEDPVELGMANREDELLERLRNDARYLEMFAAAFPDERDSINLDSITKALGAFQRSITSFNSKVDRWQQGDSTALNESEQRGMALFFGGTNEAGVADAFECFHCHGGFLFSQSSDDAGQVFDQKFFMNNGLYNLDEQGSYPPGNEGLFDTTGDPADKGRFKPPSLRNIALTAPYMHDGSIETLEEVIDHYARGGRHIESGPYAGDGRDNPNKSALLNGFAITEQEKQDLIAFLRALTDEALRTNPAFSDPFEEQ
ncbi:MAG: cytochrome C peroxidase [Myxococcales bacterium SG8_38]|nr:MAG: cytochrome C peroxidase [Myxococcales bacterium SG8_38]